MQEKLGKMTNEAKQYQQGPGCYLIKPEIWNLKILGNLILHCLPIFIELNKNR